MPSLLWTFALWSPPAVPAPRLGVAVYTTPNMDVAVQHSSSLSLLQTSDNPHILANSGACTWTVLYNRWIPTFEAGEYEHPGNQGGSHCLSACCEDPTCKGIALMSDELYQCYKYSQQPAELRREPGRALGNGHWLGQLRPAWSIFAKSGGAEASSVTLSAKPPNSKGAGDHPQALSTACEWTVHYDLWLKTFTPGEYEPANAFGGAHCLTACCQDPSCLGLALMSDEEYQCYKYRNLPTALTPHRGIPLGDGQWLSQRRPAWSIFVKSQAMRQIPAAPWATKVVPRTGVSSNGVVSAGIHSNVTRTLVLIATLAALALLVARLAMPISSRAFSFCRTQICFRGDPAARKLLEGIDLKNLS